jgi:hypothetical protein
MINIIDFWKQQTDKWNTDNKCGLCFEFSAPLVNSQINIVQSETCCVNVFLTDIKFRTDEVYNSVTGLTTSKKCIWSFSVHALVQEPLGVNNYNEIKSHPIEESKWNTIFLPLAECLGCDNILDFCDIIGKELEVRQLGDAQLIHNYLDSNWNGWKINYSFSETI